MNIKLVSTIPYLTIGSLTWGSVGASVTVDTSALKAYERALIEQEYSAGNLISNPKLTNGRIADAEDVATPSALGGEVRATVASGRVVLSAPGIPTIPAVQIDPDTNQVIPEQQSAVRAASLPTITLSGSRSLVVSDFGADIVYAGSADIVVTVPQGLGPQFKANLIQASAGRITISAAPGVTIDSLYGYSQTSGKGSAVTLISTGTNTFVLIGAGV